MIRRLRAHSKSQHLREIVIPGEASIVAQHAEAVKEDSQEVWQWADIKDSLTDVRREFPFKMNLFSKIAV